MRFRRNTFRNQKLPYHVPYPPHPSHPPPSPQSAAEPESYLLLLMESPELVLLVFSPFHAAARACGDALATGGGRALLARPPVFHPPFFAAQLLQQNAQ